MIKYRIVQRINPSNHKPKYHPTIVNPTTVSTRDLIDRIASRCTVTSADIKAVLDALEHEVIKAFSEGQIVRMGDLGSFRPTLRTSGAETADKCNASFIRSVHVVYVPSLRTKHNLDVKAGMVRFEKTDIVPPKKKKKGGGGAKPGGASGTSAAPGH